MLQDGEPVPVTPGLVKPVFPIRHLLGRKCSDLPGSQETPLYICHVLRPRPDIHARPLGRFSAAPANVTTKAPTTSVISRLNIMASVLTVYKSARVPPLLTTTQDSFPAGGQPLPGGVGYPPGLVEDFQPGASRPPGLNLAPHVCTQRPMFPYYCLQKLENSFLLWYCTILTNWQCIDVVKRS